MSYVISRELSGTGLADKKYYSKFGQWTHDKFLAKHFDFHSDALDVVSTIPYEKAKNFVFDIEKDLQYA